MGRQGAKKRGRDERGGGRKEGGLQQDGAGKRGRGPRLDAKLLRQLHGGEKKEKKNGDEDGGGVKDVYEYEEAVAEEEAGKNRRFDAVDSVEYELPSDFEDEEIDEDAALGHEDDGLEEFTSTGKQDKGHFDEGEIDLNSEDDDSEEEEDDDETHEKHQQMLKSVMGKSSQTQQEIGRSKRKAVRSEAYTESEYNITPDGNGRVSATNNVSVEELLGSLEGTPGIGTLRKRMQPLQREKQPINVPLPKVIQQRVERKVGYEKSKEEVTKWIPLVKKNREASTLSFNEREAGSTATVAALADKFKPVNEMEKEVASLLQESKLEMSEETQAAEALELHKLGVEEVRERQERLSKMRSLLFQHEAKAKRVAKIKSKTFHRLDKDKNKRNFKETDEEVAKEAHLKQEVKRAEERMTLKHKNTSRWAKRILKRGLKAHEDGTRDAIMEQLRAHSTLTKKIQSATIGSSDDSSSEEEEEGEVDASTGRKGRSKLLAKAKAATLDALQFDAEAEIPSSGLFALPFMARAIEKKRIEAQEEAVAVLEQLEQAQANDEVLDGGYIDFETKEKEDEGIANTGRFAFGDLVASISAKTTRKRPSKQMEEEYSDLDLEVDEDNNDNDIGGFVGVNKKIKKLLSKKHTEQKTSARAKVQEVGLQQDQNLAVQNISEYQLHVKDSAKDTGISGRDIVEIEQDLLGAAMFGSKDLRTTTVGAVQVSTFNKQTGFKNRQSITANPNARAEPDKNARPEDNLRENPADVAGLLDLEEDDDLVKDNELEGLGRAPTQQEFIRQAFAGDDVEADFQETKASAMDEEVARVEEQKTLPGWGQWTHVQQKRVEPGWRADIAKKNREAALKGRKDAKLQYVVISEKLDKKGAKYLASKVPFPMKTKEVFEQTMRMPIGREYNSEKVFRDLIRPAELRNAGVIIDPIKQDKSVKRLAADDVVSNVAKRRRGRLLKGSK